MYWGRQGCANSADLDAVCSSLIRVYNVCYLLFSALLTLLHLERPKLYGVLAVLSAKGLNSISALSVCWKDDNER